MLVRENYPQGCPCWAELRTPDRRGSAAFYSALFGWEFEEHALLFGDGRLVASLDGHKTAAIAAQQDLAAAGIGWTSYFAVRDAVAAVRRVVQEGGQAVLAPRNIGSAGRAALARDPAGNVFGLWEKVDSVGAELVKAPGAFTWSRLTTDDAAAVKEFYCVLFGFHTSLLPWSRNSPGHAFAVDYDLVASMAPRDVVPELEPQWLAYFTVVDVGLAAETVLRLGGSSVVPVYRLEALGAFGVFRDPQGAAFMLWQPQSLEMIGLA